jgi:flagellum-specific peptidoglycan hydrolase FlgJ
MPILLLDDATSEATRRLQEFGQGLLQPLQQAAGAIQQIPQQIQPPTAPSPSPQPLQDITARLQDFGQQTLQNTIQPLQQAHQQLQDATQRLQSFGQDQLSNAFQQAQQVGQQAQTFGSQFGGGGGAIDSSSPESFAKSFAPYAQAAAQQLGIDPGWVTAMAASESNYGKAPGNELFGIKALPGQTSQTLQTHEGEYGGTPQAASFASYGSPQESVQAFVDLIKNHYPGAVGAGNLGDFVHGLKQGGYFTAAEPEYRGILQSINDRLGPAVEGAKQAVSNVLPSISQFGDKQLTAAEAYTACGPAAAVRFASMFGRQPTLREATDLAKTVGWTPDGGMAGLSSESSLFDKLNIPHRTVGADWQALAREAQSGNPVTISTPGHYFTADSYDPSSGAFHVGSSGTDLRGVSEWMTPAQMEARMGQLQGGLAVDNPQVPGPSPLASGAQVVRNIAQGAVRTLQNITPEDVRQRLPSVWAGEQAQKIGPALGITNPPNLGDVITARQGIGRAISAFPQQPTEEPWAYPARQVLGGFLQQPGVFESGRILQQLNQKYGDQIDAQSAFASPTDVMTPEDAHAYNDALLTVSSIGGTELNKVSPGQLNFPGGTLWQDLAARDQAPIGTPGTPMFHVTGGERDYTEGMRPIGRRGYRYFADSPSGGRAGAQVSAATQTGPRTLVVDPAADMQIAQDVFGGERVPNANNAQYERTYQDSMPLEQFQALRQRITDARQQALDDPNLSTDQGYAIASGLDKLENWMLDDRNPIPDGRGNVVFGGDPTIPGWGALEQPEVHAALDRLGIDAIRASDEAGTSLAVRNLAKVSIRQPNVGTTGAGDRPQVFFSGRGAPMTEGPDVGYGYNPAFDPGTSTLGRGYYMTDDPEIAGGAFDPEGNLIRAGYAQTKAAGAPNVRKILVPDLSEIPEQRREYRSATPGVGPQNFLDTPHGQAMYDQFKTVSDRAQDFQNDGLPVPPELNSELSSAASAYLSASQAYKDARTLPAYEDTHEYNWLQKQHQALYDQIQAHPIDDRQGLDALWQQLDALDQQIHTNANQWDQLQMPFTRPPQAAGWRDVVPPSGNFHVLRTDDPLMRTSVGAVKDATGQRMLAEADRTGQPMDTSLYDELDRLLRDPGVFTGPQAMQGGDFWSWLGERLAPGGERLEKADATNALLHDAGFDGILYQGGKRQPVYDEAGNPITHRALMVFPQSAGRVTNALSFRAGGEIDPRYAAGLGLTAAGGALALNRDRLGDFMAPLTTGLGAAMGNIEERRQADIERRLNPLSDPFTSLLEANPLTSAAGDVSQPISAGLTAAGTDPNVARVLGQVANLLAPAGLEAGIRGGGPALEELLANPSVRQFATDESGALNAGRLQDLFAQALRSRAGGPAEGPIPHGMAVPETGYLAGTPEYTTEQALRTAAAQQGTARPNLSQAELQALPGMSGSHLSDMNELREAVQTGLPAMRWYTAMAEQIAKDTGETINPREAAVLMGATASNAPVSTNYHAMLSIFRAMRLAQPDLAGFENLDNAAIQQTQAFQDVAARVKELGTYVKPYDVARIMQGYRTGEIPYPSGAKLSSYTTNFLHALSDLYDPYTTQDVWQGRLMGSRLVPDAANPNKLIETVANPTITNDPTYRTAHALTNWVARELNINPREAQAAGWGVMRSLWNDEQIGPQLQTGQISLRDALKLGMQQGMFAPSQLQQGMLSDVLGGTGTAWDAKIAQARDLIHSEGLYDTSPPPSATGVESISAIHPANWKAAVGLNKGDIPRPVSEPLATELGDIARVAAPVIRVPGILEGNRIPNLLLEHGIQRAGDNSYVHLVGAGDAAAQDVASRIGGEMITHYDPDSTTLGGFAVRNLGADEQQQLARQLRMNGLPVVEGRGGGISVPLFGDESKADTLATIQAGVKNLGPETDAALSGYTGTQHPVGPGVAGGAGDTAAAQGRPDLPIWGGDQGAAQEAVSQWLNGSQPARVDPLFATRLATAALGGYGGYATTDPNASPQERLLRTGAGAAAGFAAPSLVGGSAGRIGQSIQALRVGSLAGGIPTLSHIALNTPVQVGLKLASDIPASLLAGHPEATAAELYGMLQGLRSFGMHAASTLATPGPLARSMGGGAGPQALETGLTGLVRLHPLLQDLAGQLAQHMDLWQNAATTATRSGFTRFSPAWQTEVQRLVSSPTPDMVSSAAAALNRASLNTPLGTTGQAIADLVHTSPLARFMLPIFNKGYAIATQGVETSPLGGVGTLYDVARGLRGTGPYAGGDWGARGGAGAVTPLAERIRNNIIGLALAYEGYQQAAQGNITGEGPADPAKQATLRDTGWQPDSIRVGDRYVNAHLLGPVGWPLIQGANTYEAFNGPGGAGLEEKQTPQGARPPSTLDILGDLAARQGRFFNNETFLTSMGSLLNLIGSSAQQGQVPAREAASVLESLIPQGALLSNLASAQDPYQRVARGGDPLAQIQAALTSRLPENPLVPGRQALPPRLAPTGRPLTNPQQGAGLLVPRSSVIQNDPILTEMQTLGITPVAVPKSVAFGSANAVRLTPAEQQTREQYRGAQLSASATKLMASPKYQQLNETQQRNALAEVASAAARVADGKLRVDIAKAPGLATRMLGAGAAAPVSSYAPAWVTKPLSEQLAGT